MRFTPSQQRTIDTQNCNIIVSAAAGSGKTTVMVERIIKLLAQGETNIDQLLVVTYTNAAAASMKAKISQRLEQYLIDQPDNVHLIRQLSMIGRSSIKTMHAFCSDICRRYFYLIGISPDFTVCSGLFENELKKKAQQQFLAKITDFDYPNRNRLKEYMRRYARSGETELMGNVLALHSALENEPNPNEWLNNLISMLNNRDTQLWTDTLINHIYLPEINRGIGYLEYAIQLVNDPQSAEHKLLSKELNNLKNLILIHENEDKNDLRSFSDKISQCDCFDRFLIKIQDKHLKSAIKQYRNSAKNIVKNIVNSLKSVDIQGRYISDIVPHLELLAEITHEYNNTLRTIKKDKNTVSFGDMEQYAIQILKDAHVREQLRNQFDYIFVDEYQDANPLQEEIINCIRRDDNVFYVGDVKQSIYSFRNAEPELFNTKLATYQDEANQCIYLNNNFRSCSRVLDFVNIVFDKLMTKNDSMLEYDERSRLYPLESTWQCEPDYNSLPELHIIPNEIEDNGYTDKLSQQLSIVVDRIKRLLTEKIYDPKLKQMRNIRLGDIAILSKKLSTNSSYIVQFLNNSGIAAACEGADPFKESVEIELILQLLRILDNIYDDYALLAILRSVLFNFTDQQLAMIRLQNPDLSFYEALSEYDDDINISQKINNFFIQIEQWRFMLQNSRLDDFLWQLYDQTGLMDTVNCLPGGHLRSGALQAICMMASDYIDNHQFGTTREFISYIDKKKTQDQDNEIKYYPDGVDLVKVMTIHKSKGLEFPVVFIISTESYLERHDKKDKIDKTLGIAMDYINPDTSVIIPSVMSLAISQFKSKKRRAENLRLLYVGMTRGINKLILIGNLATKPDSSNVQTLQLAEKAQIPESKSYLLWILWTVLCTKSGDQLAQQLDIYIDKYIDKNIAQVYFHESLPEPDNVEKESFDNNLTEFLNTTHTLPEYHQLAEMISYQYPYTESTQLPTKLTVTQINKAKKENTFYCQIREDDQDPLQRGTAVHQLLKYIDINCGLDIHSINAEVLRLKNSGLLTEQQASLIDPDIILATISLPVWQDMKTAQQIYREQQFCMQVPAHQVIEDTTSSESIIVQGIIDCFYIREGAAILIDYKTDSIFKDFERHARQYAHQLNLYAESINRIMQVNIKAKYILFTRTGTAVRI